MENIFKISSPSETLQLEKDGQGTTTIQVTNQAKAGMEGRLLIVPLGETQEDWFEFDPAPRFFEVGSPEEFEVKVTLPEEASEGSFSFRVDAVSEVNPDDDFAEGPVLSISRSKNLLWLWILLAVVFLLIVVLVAWLVVRSRSDEPPPADAEVAAAAEQEPAAAKDAAEAEERQPQYMPNLMGLTQDEALEQASRLGLEVGPDDWTDIEGLTVSNQKPRPGQVVDEGGVVTLELVAEMPDLQGHDELEAGFLLAETGLLPGTPSYRTSDREEGGRILAQSVAPKIDVVAGTEVDVVVSLGSCRWTPTFGEGYRLMACPAGSAISGLSCLAGYCGVWQLYCCPYAPSSDLEAKRDLSDWVSKKKETIASRPDMVLDGFECDGSDCAKKRARYLKTPRLKKGSECRTLAGGDETPVMCDEGQFGAEFACTKGKTCDEWTLTCCPGRSVAPD